MDDRGRENLARLVIAENHDNNDGIRWQGCPLQKIVAYWRNKIAQFITRSYRTIEHRPIMHRSAPYNTQCEIRELVRIDPKILAREPGILGPFLTGQSQAQLLVKREILQGFRSDAT